MRPILAGLPALLLLAGCVAEPVSPVNAVEAAGGATAADDAGAAAQAPANASAMRIKEGNYHFVVGTRPGIVFWNGDLPEVKVDPGEVVVARAEWTSTGPSDETLILRIMQGEEVAAETTGASPLEIPWDPKLDKSRSLLVTVTLPTPGATAQLDVALLLAAGPAPLSVP